jgi:hypothetical protein
MSLTMVACQQEAPHDPVLMYFVQDGPGSVYLVIEPNDVIRPSAELTVTVRNEALGLWVGVGGLTNADGSYTSQPFEGDIGDAVLVSSSQEDGEPWEVCVIVGNFGQQPASCH